MDLVNPSSDRCSESDIGQWFLLPFRKSRIHDWDFFNLRDDLYKVWSDCMYIQWQRLRDNFSLTFRGSGRSPEDALTDVWESLNSLCKAEAPVSDRLSFYRFMLTSIPVVFRCSIVPTLGGNFQEYGKRVDKVMTILPCSLLFYSISMSARPLTALRHFASGSRLLGIVHNGFGEGKNRRCHEIKKRGFLSERCTPSGNRTRVSPVAGEYSTTRPTVYAAAKPMSFDDGGGPLRLFIQVWSACLWLQALKR